MERDRIAFGFSQADLPLKLLGGPIRATNRDIFQMDVFRGRGPEYFRLWPGHGSNEGEIPSIDRRLRQLVLFVREPRRRFEEVIRKFGQVSRGVLEDRVRASGGRILREDARQYVVERWTPSVLRRFLCGMDEQHLFIAQFREGTSVRDAHASLKPAAVRRAELSDRSGMLRQGEWFFIPVAAHEATGLAEYVSRFPGRVRVREAVGNGGRPHVADEVLRVPPSVEVEGLGRLARAVLARGAVRHPDHHTVRLPDWHLVVRNAEVLPERPAGNGIYWVD